MTCEIASALYRRGITEVVHFTTNRGLVGILRSSALLPLTMLNADASLAHVLQLNAADRSRDIAWHGYINLSLHRINDYYFRVSKRWHENKDNYWCVLAFDPAITCDDGVLFATTNNAYNPYVKRAGGVPGLNALFETPIKKKPGWTAVRSPHEQACHTTCRQAEVLYPGALRLDRLTCIYVPDDDVYDEVYAKVVVLAPKLLEWARIEVNPAKFR